MPYLNLNQLETHEQEPSFQRSKEIRKDKFLLEKDKPYAEFKKLQKRLRSREKDRETRPEDVQESQE